MASGPWIDRKAADLSFGDFDAARRNQRIFDLWLACYTQNEIVEEVGCHQTVVGDVLRESADLPEW
jgi:hypothetical protein